MGTLARRRNAATLLSALLLFTVPAHGAGTLLTEAQAKAGFLYNCALFVQWPVAAAKDEIRVGIIGSERVASVADTMQGRQVNGRTLRIRMVGPGDDLRQFHIVFFGSGIRVSSEQMAILRDQPVLTVGESRDFTTTGGVVRLYTDDERLRFEINMTRVEGAGLQVSAKMLGLATIVR
jgi:hypothetical protein